MSEPEQEPNPYQPPQTDDASSQENSSVPQAAYMSTLVAAGGSVLIVTGLAFVAPGIAVIAALVLVPANLRSLLMLRKAFQANGNWPDGSQQLSAFFVTAFLMIPIWIATGIAFSAVCWAGAMIAVSIFPWGDENGISNMIYGGIPIGLIVGLISFVFCFRLSLRNATRPADGEKQRPPTN